MWTQRILLISSLVYSAFSAEDAHWGYADAKESERPDAWNDNYALCAGNKQSPIDIIQNEAKFSGILHDNPLQLHGYDDGTISKADVFLYNNGHTAVVTVADPSDRPIGMNGAGLPHHYILAQFHWHWGSASAYGSEHLFNGKAYAAEMHFVHVNSWDMGDSDKLWNSPDGFAVLGVMIEEGERNADLDLIIDHFERASQEGANETSVRLNISSLMNLLPKNYNEFFRYQGSLTTPPCNEAVIWSVMKNPITASAAQLQKFRTLLPKDKGVSNKTPAGHEMIVNNYRPVQPLNGRKVYASFTDKPLVKDPEHTSHKWSYAGTAGPTKWGETYAKCDGNRQSPIHITHSEAIPSPTMANQPWDLKNYAKTPAGFEVMLGNNGHTVVASVTEGLSVSGGGLPTSYNLIQFHFHWGSTNNQGSEHVLNGKQYAAELHFVHANRFYSKMSQLVNNGDGFAVLGVLIEVGDHNAAFDPIINQLNNIKYVTEGKDVAMSMSSLRELLPDDISEFYRYQGSLTTPPCHEAVVWTVFKQTITMSATQLNSFRTEVYNMKAPNNTNIVSETPDGRSNVEQNHNTTGNAGPSHSPGLVIDNFRPLQKLNDRIVRYAKILQKVKIGNVSAAEAGPKGLAILVLVSFFATWMFL